MSTDNPWEQFFAAHAASYDREVFTQNTELEVVFLMSELGLQPGQAVLDMGCGTGRHAVALAKKGLQVTGVDLSAAMLARARQAANAAGVELHLVNTDAVRFTVSSRFDAAYCLCEGALCLLGSGEDAIDRDEVVLRNICNALKPGGRFMCTVLSACRLIRHMDDDDVRAGRLDPISMCEITRAEIEIAGIKKTIEARERTYTPPEFAGMMRRAGFVVDSVWGGTAGKWYRMALELDEMEIMFVGHRPA